MTEEILTKVVEIEGRQIVYLERRDGMCSFDAGASWHESRIEAYEKAKESDALSEPGGGQSEEFEAWVLGLIREVQALERGESLRVVRTESEVLVLRERAVLAARASSVREIDLRVE